MDRTRKFTRTPRDLDTEGASEWNGERDDYLTRTTGIKGARPVRRYIGCGQPIAVAILKAWFKTKGWTYRDVAERLGWGRLPRHRGELRVRQYLAGAIALPVHNAAYWATSLTRHSDERQAIIDLFALAAAHHRVLLMLGRHGGKPMWKTRMLKLGRVLGVDVQAPDDEVVHKAHR